MKNGMAKRPSKPKKCTPKQKPKKNKKSIGKNKKSY